MKVDIWMPIYIGDYVRDTQELTTEEHGAYLLLLMHYWQKNGKIGKDIKRLSHVTKTSEEIINYILENYFNLSNGHYRNKRADIEMENAKQRSEAGKKAANARWSQSDSNADAMRSHNDSNAKGDADSMRSECSSSSSSSSSLPSSSKSPSKKKEARYGIEDIIKMFDAWNKQYLPKYPEGLYKTGVNIKDSGEILNYLKSFNKIEISQALRNYAKIRKSSEHELKPEYGDALGFFKAGIHKYYDNADPFKRCMKKSFFKTDDPTDEDRERYKKQQEELRKREKERGNENH